MKDELAERLLAAVLKWRPEDISRERPKLQAIAAYKYDDYQQFSPGMRFIESFALWLSQFKTDEERSSAYELVMNRLIYCSSAEMNHLVSIAYIDCIRPVLLRAVALEAGLSERHVGKVANSLQFRLRQRQTLFLGLSDGAHTDMFRRANPQLSHEQVRQTYEITPPRAQDLLHNLRADVRRLGISGSEEAAKFRTLVLLDDFSASGVSYLRREGKESFSGKIARLYDDVVKSEGSMAQLVDIHQLEVLVVVYLGTQQAREHIEQLADVMWAAHGVKCRVLIVYPLQSHVCIRPGTITAIDDLVNKYYDPSIEDDSTRKGGTDLKYGFAQCGLPLVLSHNTPNNTLSLIWARSDTMHPLFPRVSRFQENRG